jgi:hypothetical protein
MARITHPRPQLGRQRFLGIEFIDGFAEVEELHAERKQALLQHGFTIKTLMPNGITSMDFAVPADVDRDPELVDLTELKLPELRNIAGVEGIDFPPKATRAQLIDLISRQPAEPAVGFAVVEMPDGTIIGDGESLATLPSTSFN